MLFIRNKLQWVGLKVTAFITQLGQIGLTPHFDTLLGAIILRTNSCGGRKISRVKTQFNAFILIANVPLALFVGAEK